MKPLIHRLAAITATLCISTFFVSTILVELFGTYESIAQVKSLIVKPGLFILITAIAITGATGFMMSKDRGGKIVENKKKRMPFVAANGFLILIPSAIVLNQWASAGDFSTAFYLVQAIELVAGACNIALMAINIKDGRKLTRKKG